MIIAGAELKQLVKDGVISGLLSEDQINAASIDLTLSDTILVEPMVGKPTTIRLQERDSIVFNEMTITGSNYTLAPGEFILASTNEVFNLPNNISCMYKLKSSMARAGLDHLNAGWCDAGWHDSVLTLEFVNVTNRVDIVLDHNTKIGQVIFFKHAAVGKDQSYATKGSYNKQTTATSTRVGK
ncbi:MAG: dCTP deaminase [Shewanella sp. CG18_big_fil_WC_8_21_14_2_50_42_11]|uniref:dCTP deaminase n=1 Tax=Shewanella sp. CG18_big_fil_WC_8_21_14_2_50_42_11 TaxID=1975538 RepID=UPI000C5AFADD|nr:dCTP deaminase [Shewanella sp. CG18_big_fil_WC_8_21_14_2_50_42_11]PIQ00592.1 MAG: dCTP deaminase [Shewanella sp. CG18_big_fil_WC_8_21_14_2_50_42_11]